MRNVPLENTTVVHHNRYVDSIRENRIDNTFRNLLSRDKRKESFREFEHNASRITLLRECCVASPITEIVPFRNGKEEIERDHFVRYGEDRKRGNRKTFEYVYVCVRASIEKRVKYIDANKRSIRT